MKISTTRAAAAAGVLATAAAGMSLAFAGPASAEQFDKFLAVDCPQPFSQNCAVRQGMTVWTTGPLFVTFTANSNPPSCAPGRARIFIDGNEWGSAVVWPDENDGGYYMNVAPGSHLVEVQMDGVLGGCNTGAMSGWTGYLHVETNADALNGATA